MQVDESFARLRLDVPKPRILYDKTSAGAPQLIYVDSLHRTIVR